MRCSTGHCGTARTVGSRRCWFSPQSREPQLKHAQDPIPLADTVGSEAPFPCTCLPLVCGVVDWEPCDVFLCIASRHCVFYAHPPPETSSQSRQRHMAPPPKGPLFFLRRAAGFVGCIVPLCCDFGPLLSVQRFGIFVRLSLIDHIGIHSISGSASTVCRQSLCKPPRGKPAGVNSDLRFLFLYCKYRHATSPPMLMFL